MDSIGKETFDISGLMDLLEYAEFKKSDSKSSNILDIKGLNSISHKLDLDPAADDAEENKEYYTQNFYLEGFLNIVSEDNYEDAGEDESEVPFTEGDQLKKKIIKILKKIEDYFATRSAVIEKEPAINLNDIQLVLAGIHLIRLYAGKNFNEERRRLVVRYKDSKDIHALEKKGKKLNLSWIENGPKLDFQNRAYAVAQNSDELLEAIIEDLPGIHKVRIDDDPSIAVKHNFFELFAGSGNRAKQFLLDGLGSFLHLLARGKTPQEGIPKELFDTYKHRLFFRSLFLTLHINWVGKEEQLRDLLVLNCLNFLMSEKVDMATIDEHFAQFKATHPLTSSSYEKNYNALGRLIDRYYEWREVFQNIETKKTLISELAREKIGKTIFKSRFGFMRLKSIPFKGIHVITPLGELDKKENIYQRVIQEVGTKAVFFE